LEKVDYCGLMSGKRVDKSEIFEVFYGDLETAPMIVGCPICMECRLIQTIELPTHYLFVGEIIASYADENYLSDGGIDTK